MALVESDRFVSVNMLVCERVLQEAQDGVLTAIRMIDTFLIPKDRAPNFHIQFWVVASAKIKPGIAPFEVVFSVIAVGPTGERTKLGEERIMSSGPLDGKQNLPTGAGLIIHMGFVPKMLGVSYLEVEIDGEPGVMARFPITVVEVPQI